MSHRYPYLLVVLLTLFLAACGGQGAGDVSGTWSGEITETQEAFSLQLTQSGTTLNGNFTVQGAQPVQMTGTVAGNLISLSVQGSGGSVSIEASVSGNSLQGNLIISANTGQSATYALTASK